MLLIKYVVRGVYTSLIVLQLNKKYLELVRFTILLPIKSVPKYIELIELEEQAKFIFTGRR
jgi:hypothetical protein